MGPARATATPSDRERAIFRKVSWRLLPFLFVLYIAAYIDRVNLSFVDERMGADLGFSDTLLGIGKGIFFLGYFVFEVPSNLLLQRFGARRWIARIMITWGLVSAATYAITGPVSFCTMRLLLGVAEAGFFPGVILYLTYWFPADYRGRAVARFMTATALAGVVGAPLSAAILPLHGFLGLHGWQWVFILEGIPSVLLGVAVLFVLTDRPAEARWLSAAERDWLDERLRREKPAEAGHAPVWRQMLRDRRVWLLTLLYFVRNFGSYGLSLWLPSIVREATRLSGTKALLLTAVPYLLGAAAMVLVGQHSDRSGERRWHVALPSFLAAGGLLLCAVPLPPEIAMFALSMAGIGIYSSLGPFWAMTTSALRGRSAAGGIAVVNSFGNLGGFVGPALVGFLQDRTGNQHLGLCCLAVGLVATGLLGLAVRDPDRPATASGS